MTGLPRHRSHFGSRYKLGCCGHASLFGGVDSLNVCFVFLLSACLSDCVAIFVSVSRGGAINQRGYIVIPQGRHRSHFGSRYKLGCCGHASLFGGLASAPSECQCIFLSVSLSLSMFLFVSVRASRRGLTAIQTAMPVAAWGSRFRMRSSQHQRRGRNI